MTVAILYRVISGQNITKHKSRPIVVQVSGTYRTTEQNFYYKIYVIKLGRFCKDLTHSLLFFNIFKILSEQLH